MAAGALPAQYLRPADVDALPSRPPDAREAYGTDPLQVGELRLPEGHGPFPVAIVIHGGCWVARYAAARNTAALATALQNAGIASWNVEYRRADDPGGGWPGTFTDVAAAADHLRDLAHRFPLDTTRVVAIGHSAGAQLALWLAARRRLPATSPVRGRAPFPITGVVALGGIGDLAEFATRESETCGAGVVERLMGGAPSAVPERYAQASPIALLPLGVPQVLIAGDHDRIAPASVRDAWVAAATKAGDRATSVTVADAGHHEVVAPTTAAWPLVLEAMRLLLGLADSHGADRSGRQ